MFGLITILFIAQLIICSYLVNAIIKLDRNVCALNNRVISTTPVLGNALKEFHSAVHNFKDSFFHLIYLIKKKKRIYILNLAKNFILYFVLVFSKGKYKRAAAFFHLVMLAAEYMDKPPQP